jgi:hypothetical protein
VTTEPAPGRLQIVPLWRDVLRAYSHHWKLLVPLAVVVLLPGAVGDALIGEVEIERVHTIGDVARLASVPLAVAINLGGEALYAGIVAAAVVHWRAGETLRELREVVREIPYLRLIAIDLLIAVGAAAAFALLVVPGLILYTYVAISPALVEVKRLSVRAALRRSIELVRGNFWGVLLFTAAVALVTDSLAAALESPLEGLHGDVLFNLAIEAAVEPFQGLATVLLALALLEMHGDRVTVGRRGS